RVDGFDTPRSLLWLKFLDLIYSLRTRSILPEADIIVTNTFWLPILPRDSKRGKIYVHVGRYPKGQMRFYGKAARLQAPSHSVARAIASEAPRLGQKVTAISYPVTRSIRQRTDSQGRTITASPAAVGDRDKIILFVGRVHPEKGVHLLGSRRLKRWRRVAPCWFQTLIASKILFATAKPALFLTIAQNPPPIRFAKRWRL